MTNINFTPFPKLASKNYVLRQLVNEDAKEIFAIRSDPKISEFLDREVYKSIDEAKGFIEKINTGIQKDEWIYWGVHCKDNKQLIGTICLWNFSEDKTKADIGFELMLSYQGKGIMQEVIPVILDYGFSKLGLSAIEGEVAPGNIKSIKLMQKYGFVLSEDENGEENSAVVIYYLSSEKWRECENNRS